FRGHVADDAARAAARAARTAKAAARAADLAPVIAELRAAGVTSLGVIARALNERGIETARGSTWTPMAVSRVIKRGTLAGNSADTPSPKASARMRTGSGRSLSRTTCASFIGPSPAIRP